jgi:hypothetical protein
MIDDGMKGSVGYLKTNVVCFMKLFSCGMIDCGREDAGDSCQYKTFFMRK